MVWVLVLLIAGVNPVEEYRYSSDRLEVAMKSWEQRGYALEGRTNSFDGLLGKVHVHQYRSPSGQTAELLLHTDASGIVYDITLNAGIPAISDVSITHWYSLVILNRVLWIASTGDDQLLRAAMQTPGMTLQSNQLLEPEQLRRTFSSVARNQQTDLTVDFTDGGRELTAVFTHRGDHYTLSIRPTLNLITNGDVALYRNFILGMIDRGDGIIANRMSPYFGSEYDRTALELSLPQLGLYRSRWEYTRESVSDAWTLVRTLPDWESSEPDWIHNHAGFWSTLAFPDSINHRGIQRSNDFQMDLSVMAEQPVQRDNINPGSVTSLLGFAGERLPSYFLVSEVKDAADYVEVHAFWLVYHPELQFQHVLRVTDHVRTVDDVPVWFYSKISGMLALRLEQIEQLDADLDSAPVREQIRIQIRQ